jgi:Lar family restriction alleviation protein
MGNELKPCPFCGGAASLALCGFGTAKATCMDCGSEGAYSPSREDAIAAWNRRSSSASDPVGEPVAWLLEFTDPHDGKRSRTVWMNKPRDYELMPGDTVSPLYASPLPQEPREAELTDENERLRQLLCDVLKALGNGSGASPECSMQFLSYIPEEVRAVVADLRGAQEGKASYTQEQVDAMMSHTELALALRSIGGPLNEAAANSILYLAAQEGLLEKAQQAAERAYAELGETRRPLNDQMARLNQRVIELNADAARLDFLDRTNARFRMGWKVGKAPAGNVSVQSIIHAVGRVIGIREAIDAARSTLNESADSREDHQ